MHFILFWSTLKISESFVRIMCRKFSGCLARHPSKILSNTQNTVDRKEDKDDKEQQGAGIELMKDKQVLTLPMHRTDIFAVF